MNTLHNPGDVIAGRYQIIKVLGHGGMGITYAAKDLQPNQSVALKVLTLNRIKDWKVLELCTYLKSHKRLESTGII